LAPRGPAPEIEKIKEEQNGEGGPPPEGQQGREGKRGRETRREHAGEEEGGKKGGKSEQHQNFAWINGA
jgi:hypothetical protein